MRKEFDVHIVIKDSGPVRDSNTKSKPNGNKFRVEIYPLPDKAPIPDLLAHELGHVIANIFDTPKNAADPRVESARKNEAHLWNLQASMFGVSDEEMKRMHEGEEEAWDFAKKMWPEVKDESVRWALDTYTQGGEL